MKIGIITFTDGTNYGQRLQNLALQVFLETFENEVYTIEGYDVEKKCLSKLKKIVKIIINYQNTRLYQKRERAFKDFNKSYIKFSDFSMNKLKTLKKANGMYDYFVCGSDQIWNPNCPTINENYFLQFADYKKRIAFAPSFAVNSIPKSFRKQYTQWIKDIKYLSVREDKGVEIIEKLCGITAQRITDPTLLLDAEEWDKFSTKPKIELPEQYYLTYFLGNVEKYKDVLKRKEERVSLFDLNEPKYFSFSPSEFLYAIKHAKLVITDSFHGTIFSIIFRKNFIVIPREDQMGDMSSRLKELLKRFNLEDRYLLKGNIPNENILQIDYTLVEKKIDVEKKRAIVFWEKCIGDKNHEE